MSNSIQQPVADVSEYQVGKLVDVFYHKIHSDERLGAIFAAEIGGNWDVHLTKMKQFWRSVLLKTREYQGRPVPAHVKLCGIKTEDFRKWLSLFRQSAHQVLPRDTAEIAIGNAERIASSLWLAMNNDPFASPPVW